MTSWHELYSYYHEPDDTPPQRRTHCIGCGGFLPKEPEVSYRQDPDTGEVWEADVVWLCKRCGRTHDADEVWE